MTVACGSPALSPAASLSGQQAAALASLGLVEATGVHMAAPERFRWVPGQIALGGFTLTNATGTDWRFPFEFSLVQWDGPTWTPLPCRQDDPTNDTSSGGLCSVSHINTRLLGPHETITQTDARLQFIWPSTAPVSKGTYALVLPLWQSSEDEPDRLPREGAATIVELN